MIDDTCLPAPVTSAYDPRPWARRTTPQRDPGGWYCRHCATTDVLQRSVFQPAWCSACVVAVLQDRATARKASAWLIQQRELRRQAIKHGLRVSDVTEVTDADGA